MSYTVKRVTGFTLRVEDRAGLLAEMLEGVRNEGAMLLAVAGWTEGKQAALFGIPTDPQKARSAAARNGIKVEERDYVWVEGDDRPGALIEFSRKLATRGINVETVHALAVEGKFAAIFALAADDLETVLKMDA
jgi:hypothetical protein